MNTYDIRLIAMDMDGTLLNSRQEISEGNVRALRMARERGVHIALCSGRCCGDNRSFAEHYGLGDVAILSLNGAYCLLPGQSEPYESHAFTPDALAQCLALLKVLGNDYGCFSANRIVYVFSSERSQLNQWVGRLWTKHAPECLYGADALGQLQTVNKFIYVDNDPAHLEESRERFRRIDGLNVTSSWYNNLEIMPVGADKGAAVRGLAKRLGIPLEQVMTFGDNDNDLGMIECAGLGVAMANANERVKSAAKYVTLTNDEDGVADAVSRFVLNDSSLT